MATAIWSNKRNKAPCTIFSSTTLSPRQIANKAYTLGCKKLDRDDKQSKQKYHVRERLLLCNTIAKAEEVLNARTRRTNRRVMAAEDEEADEFSAKHTATTKDLHSPLRSSSAQEEEDESIIPNTTTTTTTTSFNNNASILLPRDCRNVISPTINSPIATTIT
ncbi:uncharacterized protein EV154DRAFT_490241 [Mucor mucedo]|uniref:uncharacterized protein n=1 Tax=Mucor mucedo TaxID=29922 RepID=UPI00221EA4D2|nr:uncharacterized protein EV154DRAFT_490241 [Mucor mucedo]KAI7897030.1 hypothetical protein EV154DRAFT_490241 [Mucor mucedo]